MGYEPEQRQNTKCYGQHGRAETKDQNGQQDGGDARDMLHKFIHAHHANPDTIDAQGIISLLMSTITGAGDTTAATMTAIMFYLLRNPVPREKLRKEVQDAGLSNDEVPSYIQTSKLPYLAAVIKESMRLFPVSTWPLERLVPFGGINVARHFIQAGTSVGIFVPALHLDQYVFGKDVETFRPERWLNVDTERVKKMEQTFMGFSKGRRVCLGQHVAVMQMKKVVLSLIMSFDLNFMDANARLDADMSPAVACLKPLWVVVKERL